MWNDKWIFTISGFHGQCIKCFVAIYENIFLFPTKQLNICTHIHTESICGLLIDTLHCMAMHFVVDASLLFAVILMNINKLTIKYDEFQLFGYFVCRLSLKWLTLLIWDCSQLKCVVRILFLTECNCYFIIIIIFFCVFRLVLTIHSIAFDPKCTMVRYNKIERFNEPLV